MENEINNLVVQDNISNEEIKNLIYTIRGKQVMLDSDVAMLYHYTTKNINKAVELLRASAAQGLDVAQEFLRDIGY